MPRIKNYLVRTYFDKRNDKHVVCKNEKCNKLLNVHAGNLERHLKTFHPSVYYTYLQRKTSNVLNRTNTDTVKLSCLVNKKHIRMALIDLFTKCGRQVDLAEDQPFKVLLSPILDALKIKLSEQNILENIAEFSLNLKKELSKEFRGRLITVKIDAATRSTESLLSVNVQLIKNNSVIIKTLGIKQLTQPLSSEYLKTLLLDVLSDYNINLDQVVTITTDNVADTFQGADDLSNSPEAVCVQNDLICEDWDLSIDGISSVRCGVHTLQVCAMDVLESPDIKDKLDIMRAIIRKLRTQLYLKLSTSENYKMPILDNSARWTSTYEMLERFVELKDFIEDIKHDMAVFEASCEIWHFAAEFLSVFKVIYSTSKKLQSTNVIYSDLYIEITNITIQLESLPKSVLKFYLIESLTRQKLKLFENDLFVTAVFLDPRIKVCLASDQCARAKSCITQFYTRLLYLREGDTKIPKQSKSATHRNTTPSVASLESGNAEDALEEYFKAFDQVANNNIFTTSHQIEQDILAYSSQSRLGIKENIIDFWSKQNNALTEIAHLVLGIPCTQVSVRRLVSALDYLQANQGSKHDFASLEHILLVKSNADFSYD